MRKKFASAVGVGFIALALLVSAQESSIDIIATWTTNNLYPSDYRGKALPSEESPVLVSAQILENGRLIEPSKTYIKWYLDGKFQNEGDGLNQMLFYTSKRAGNSHIVRVIATAGELSASKTIEIPVVSKEVVVESDKGISIPANSGVTFTAVPYFFNAPSLSDLAISWKIQKRDIPGENKNTLFVQFGTPRNAEQGEVGVTSLIKEKSNVFQKTSGDLSIYVGF